MRTLAVLLLFVGAIWAESVSYEGYKLYRVYPATEKQTAVLARLQDVKHFDFWSKIPRSGRHVDVMVSPSVRRGFDNVLSLLRIRYEVLINNMERVVQEERDRRLQAAPRLQNGKISFTEYHTYDQIVAYLQETVASYPNIASLENIGKSFEGRDMWAIRISTGGGGSRPAILVDGAFHAREWISPAFVTYMIQELVENSANADMIATVDWLIIPVINPDGYEYTSTDRFWRKTRSEGQICTGTDPNRNCDFHWAETGSSDNECSEIYHGTKGFSEMETSNLRDYSLANAGQIKMYLTFHSYGEYVLYPWGWTSDLPSNGAELDDLGNAVADAIRAVDGTRYTVGSSTNVLYSAAGGSDDWEMGVNGVSLSYTIELPGGGSQGFDLPPSRIMPVCEETWAGVVVFHNYVANQYVKN